MRLNKGITTGAAFIGLAILLGLLSLPVKSGMLAGLTVLALVVGVVTLAIGLLVALVRAT